MKAGPAPRATASDFATTASIKPQAQAQAIQASSVPEDERRAGLFAAQLAVEAVESELSQLGRLPARTQSG